VPKLRQHQRQSRQHRHLDRQHRGSRELILTTDRPDIPPGVVQHPDQIYRLTSEGLSGLASHTILDLPHRLHENLLRTIHSQRNVHHGIRKIVQLVLIRTRKIQTEKPIQSSPTGLRNLHSHNHEPPRENPTPPQVAIEPIRPTAVPPPLHAVPSIDGRVEVVSELFRRHGVGPRHPSYARFPLRDGARNSRAAPIQPLEPAATLSSLTTDS
jgi:hypothetical protein